MEETAIRILLEPTDDSAAVTSSVAYRGNGRHSDAFRGDILADVTTGEEVLRSFPRKQKTIPQMDITGRSIVSSLVGTRKDDERTTFHTARNLQ
ncbi:hypothetical protein ANTQUA_LOCUS8434 [Anthophora quadrimaculata]